MQLQSNSAAVSQKYPESIKSALFSEHENYEWVVLWRVVGCASSFSFPLLDLFSLVEHEKGIPTPKECWHLTVQTGELTLPPQAELPSSKPIEFSCL